MRVWTYTRLYTHSQTCSCSHLHTPTCGWSFLELPWAFSMQQGRAAPLPSAHRHGGPRLLSVLRRGWGRGPGRTVPTDPHSFQGAPNVPAHGSMFPGTKPHAPTGPAPRAPRSCPLQQLQSSPLWPQPQGPSMTDDRQLLGRYATAKPVATAWTRARRTTTRPSCTPATGCPPR